jgi:hypothetical protein
MPTVYDGLFPNGTFLTRATREQPPQDNADPARDERLNEPEPPV